MSLRRAWLVLKKDLKLGPRGPMFMFALVMPVLLTLILQGAFGSLFEPRPRLGIVDAGRSEITAAIERLEGIELTIMGDAEALKARVRRHDLDAGLILPAGFDDTVRAGKRPLLELYISGESLASNRVILAVTAIDLVRGLEGEAERVVVRTVRLGEEGLPLATRLVPILVFYALVLAGIWIPAASLVDEKERRTLTALLVTPVKKPEVLVAKWTMGIILSVLLAVVTLALNRAFGPNPLHVVTVVLVAAVMTTTLGLLAGVFARSSTELFALTKGSGLLLFAPVIFYIFPDWPQWIAKLFPLYWVIEPVWRVSVMGEALRTVWVELVVALGISLALVPAIILMGRRMEV